MGILLRGEEFEYLGFFSYDRPGIPVTFALAMFACNLMRIKPNGEDWVRMRSLENHQKLLNDRARLGREGMRDEVLREIGDRDFCWTQNKYPYKWCNGSTNLLHKILWSNPHKSGTAIGPDIMELKIAEEFPGLAVFAFENGEGRKSMDIPHAHAIVDMLSAKSMV